MPELILRSYQDIRERRLLKRHLEIARYRAFRSRRDTKAMRYQ